MGKGLSFPQASKYTLRNQPVQLVAHMATTTRNRSEEIEQARFIKWTHKVAVRELMPALRFIHHSPNGGKRSAFTGAQMKALGVKPGFPDLILPVAKRLSDTAVIYPGLVIEMKSAIGTLSPEQKDWKAHFVAEGWLFRLARTAQEARTQVCLYLGIPPNSAPPLDD